MSRPIPPPGRVLRYRDQTGESNPREAVRDGGFNRCLFDVIEGSRLAVEGRR